MRDLFTKILDVLFPPTEAQLLVRSLRVEDAPLLLHIRLDPSVTTLADYRNPNVRALIHEAKFHGSSRAFAVLGELMRHFLENHRHTPGTILVPIPLSPVRRRVRGYNQVSVLLRVALKGNTTLHMDERALRRVRHTKPQTELQKKEREQNVTNAFSVRDPERVRGRHLILVDDVYTTGATMRAAKAALLPHRPASVMCVAIAH